MGPRLWAQPPMSDNRDVKMRISDAFRQYGVELQTPQFNSSAVGGEPRQLVVSLWAHNFSSDWSSYAGRTDRWQGAGKHVFRRHLQQAIDESLPIRVVVATSESPEEVQLGNASRVTNDFEPDFRLVGRVVALREDGFELEFEENGDLPAEASVGYTAAGVKYWHVAEAVEALKGPSSKAEVRAWLAAHYPHENHSDVSENLTLLTVNDANRRHYNNSREDWRSNTDHAHDLLFRQGRLRGVTYEPFRPGVHGHWNLKPSLTGKWEVTALHASPESQLEAQAQEQAFSEQPPINSDQDARVWAMRAVAQRRGQPLFRARLLDAYERRCAVTGCSAVEVLEAAHILPYKGEHTNRVDNGMLLRADLHTLFDCGLLWINGDYEVELTPSLQSTDYGQLEGKKLRLPLMADNRPNLMHLHEHAKRSLARTKNSVRED